MRKLLVLVFAVMLGGVSAALPARAEDKMVYDMVGTNPGDNQGSYRGTVTLQTRGRLLVVTWILSDGSRVVGTGIANGNTMAVGYPSGKGYGVCLYTRDPATEVVTGYWAMSGSSQFGTERWTLRR